MNRHIIMEPNPFVCCENRAGKSSSNQRILKEEKDNQNGFAKKDWIDPTKSKLCGVGINFQVDKTGALVIRSLIPEGNPRLNAFI